MNTSSAAPTTTVYYDGACPICSREIAQYRKVQGAERLDFVDVTACDANGLGPGLSRDAALARIHGPAGLAIGGKSPAEIAVSVLAQLIAARNGKPTRLPDLAAAQ